MKKVFILLFLCICFGFVKGQVTLKQINGTDLDAVPNGGALTITVVKTGVSTLDIKWSKSFINSPTRVYLISPNNSAETDLGCNGLSRADDASNYIFRINLTTLCTGSFFGTPYVTRDILLGNIGNDLGQSATVRLFIIDPAQFGLQSIGNFCPVGTVPYCVACGLADGRYEQYITIMTDKGIPFTGNTPSGGPFGGVIKTIDATTFGFGVINGVIRARGQWNFPNGSVNWPSGFAYSVNTPSAYTTIGQINALPTVSAGSNDSFCDDIGNQLVTQGSPTGGTWSGSTYIASDGTFNTNASPSGTHTVTYTYTDGNGCTNSANKNVTVVALPPTNAGSDASACDNSGLIPLGGTPNGGTWSGSTYVSGTNFDTGTAPSGIYNLTYSYTSSTTGCTKTDDRVITVNALPSVSAGSNFSVCIGNGNVALTGASPNGGTWSGTGVSSSTFNPVTAGVGTHTITYSYSDGTCSNSATRSVTVLSSPIVDAGVNLSTCTNAGLLSLSGESPVGGTWSGAAVSGNQFNPTIGAGTYTITYSYTNVSGCSSSDTRIITVNVPPTVVAGSNLTACTNGADFSLTGASPSGGTWSGTGLNGPSTFSPSTSGVGTFTLTYSYTNSTSGCTNTSTRTVTVSSPTVVTIGSNKTFCSNSGAYNLNTDVSASYLGGTWSGSGVSGNNFNPSNVITGAYTITYTYTNGQTCVSSQSKQFTVVTGPSVDAGNTMDVCINEGLVNLVGESPTGGTWSGFGVENGNQFNPATTGTGVYVVTYSYTNSTCTVTDTRQVIVNGATPVDAGNNINVCSNAADFLLTGASINGGVWNGTGVAGGFFSPSSVTPGTYVISYTYTNNKGCQSTDTRQVTVNAAPVVNAGIDITLCNNGNIYNLIADVNVTGGGFTGTGVQVLNFNPSVAGVGVHQINYTYTNPATNCSSTDFRYITVIAPQTVTIGGNQTVCIDAAPFALTGQSISGGIYSGNGVNAGIFNPAVAGIGNYLITYSVPDVNGCNAVCTKTISVIALPTVEAGPDIFVCSGSPLVSLNGTGSPVGGTFTGTFVSGGNFNVGSSGSGTFTVTYTYTNANGCVNSDTKNIIVDAGATVSAGSDFSVCVGDPLVDLASRVSPGGGTFVGTGVTGNNFNPSAGPGNYTITYSLANSYGCSGTDTFVVTVNALPSVNAGSTKTLCFNAPAYDLSLTAIPTGGSFFGPGVNGNLFDPTTAGVGTHTVYYTYTNPSGCSNTRTRTITVTDLPTVNAGSNIFLCANGNLVDLNIGVLPVNGTWTGPGVVNGIFNPTLAGVGIHVTRYTITQANGCSNYDDKVVTVFAPLVIDAGPNFTVCSNAAVVSLTNGASVTGGTWSGTSVTGSNFSPAIGAGTYVVTLNYTDFYGCSALDSKTITVISPAIVSVGSDLSVCITAPTIDLSSSVFPTGGTFTGTGVSGNIFSPSLAGIGTHPIGYTVTDGVGCNTTKTRTIIVTAPPVIDAGANKVVCISGGLVDLDAGASITGGTWSGTTVSGSFFNPVSAGLGTYVITYSYNNGTGCISTDTKTITVRADATVNAGIDLTFCVNANSFDLTNQADKPGGVWSGVGLTNTVFSPVGAGVGTHVLTYRYTDTFGCVAQDTKNISVNNKPVVSAGSPVALCTTASVVNLNASVFPSGGSWTGAGITGSFFNPQIVGAGLYSLNYSVTDANGCLNSATKSVTVSLPPTIDTGPNKTICLGSGLLDLDLSSGVAGGVWTGAGVSNNQFDPSFAGLGNHLVTYTYNDGQGCISTDTKTIIVRNNPVVNAGSDFALCKNASFDLNTKGIPLNGIWSGQGVNNSIFNTSNVGLGVHSIKYSYSDSYGCSVSDNVLVTVNPIPTVDAGPTVNICSTGIPLNLDLTAFPSGGIWLGPGISGSIFTPSIGAGSYNISYSLTNTDGCTNSDARAIIVTVPPTITIGANRIICVNSSSIDLDLNVSQVGGTWSGSAGLQNNFFNPSLAGVGTHTVTYTYNDGQGCISTASKTIQVRPSITVNAGIDASVCINSPLLNLTLAVDKFGGTFSGNGVSGTNFNPALAGIGSHVITYIYSDAIGCTASDTRTITVNNVTVIDAGPDATVCTTASLFDLSTSVSIAGGVWSGPGITGNNFNPSSVGVGTFNLLYSYSNANGCVSSDTRRVGVTVPQAITIGANLILCLNSSSIDLDLNVSQIGGSWSGTSGLQGNFFNPSLAGVGTHTVAYTYNNGQGCISTASKTIQVRPSITVDAGIDASVCVNSALLNLSLAVDKSGGVFSGNGVTGTNFNPSVAGIGNHVITYSYSDAIGCVATDTRTITVNNTSIIDAGPDASICTTAPLLDLTTAVSITGGVWSGPGVTGNNFNPATVGVGTFNLTYSYSNINGCVTSDIRKVTVTVPQTLSIGANKILCVNSAKIDLDLDVNQTQIGGTWSGSPALEGSFFNPLVAGIGTYTITFTYNNGAGCISTASKIIQVRAAIIVNAGVDKTFCKNSGTYSLANDPNILSGTWSGTGISGSNFSPSVAGVGTHIITYVYKDEFSCVAIDTRTFTVSDLITVNAGPDINVCTAGASVNLASSGFPSGGSWSGQGISGTFFDPATVGAGTYSITYTYSNANACTGTDTKQVTVSTPPVVEAGANFEICINAAPLALTGASPVNGTWSGSGIIAGIFDPLSAGLGSRTLTYSFTDTNGCTKSDQISVTVLAEPILTVGGGFSVCLNDRPKSLLPEVSIKGGAFSGKGMTGTIFNPGDAGAGTHVITYTVRFNGCDLLGFRNVTVNKPEAIEIGDNKTVCVESNPYDLIKDVNIIDGIFTGKGITGSVFDPGNAGVGSHVITYTFTNAFGCISLDFRVITVQDQLPINAGDDLTLCNSVTSFNLNGKGVPENGIYVGTGVLNNVFNPSVTGLGIFKIDYVVDNGNGCVSKDEIQITVKPSTITDFGLDSIVCVTAKPIPLNFTTKLTGGRWHGTGAVANVFYPSLAGVGTQYLTYTNQTLDCDIVGKRSITVVGLPKDATSDLRTMTACEGSFITLKSKVADADRVNNVSVGWYLENNQQAFETGEEIFYQVTKSGKVYYKSIDQYGCTSGQKDYINIQTNNPSASITSSAVKIAFAKPVQFFATSAKNAEKFEWDFGDGLLSYEKNPWHYYYQSGQFDIALKLTSASGCVTTIKSEKYLEVLPEVGRDQLIAGLRDMGEGEHSQLLSFYPNPHGDELKVLIKSEHTLYYEATATSAIGVTVPLGKHLLTKGDNEIILNTGSLSSGVYFIRVTSPVDSFNFKSIKQ